MMVDRATNPAGWAMLVQELDDAREHLEALVATMVADGRIDQPDFAVQLGHVYAHLNRAWNGRSDPEAAISDASWDVTSRFPADLNPVG